VGQSPTRRTHGAKPHPTLMALERRLEEEAKPEKARLLARFFKTGPGEYGEGDVFLGIMVPGQRRIAGEFRDLSLGAIQTLLDSAVHEKRLIGLLILVERMKRADGVGRREIFRFYLKNTGRVNNWDLVDLSAPRIVGEYLADKDRAVLYRLARSKNLWERRIAALATFWFIRDGDFADSLAIGEILLGDEHDLIHKAVGWMLREVGKRDLKAAEDFLRRDGRYKTMPRTMLRYAIEKFPEGKRKKYLAGKNVHHGGHE
jgi:3-methyladenine DNA glycosylase AlkD